MTTQEADKPKVARKPGRPRSAPANGVERAGGERGGIQSLERAASLLDAVAEHPEGISLADLSVKVGLHTSTAFHLIKTLVNLGFLSQSAESKKYRIGAHLFALAAGALDESTLLALASPILERLSAETGEASHLAVLSHHEVTVVARTQGPGLLQLAARPGATRPAHATGIGKLLLAFMPEAERGRVIGAPPLKAYTPYTITDPEALSRELDEIAGTGLAHDRREFDADVRCIAVPVYDFAGRCAGALGISGPHWRLSDEVMAAHARVLRKAADDLSAQLGYRG